MARGKSRQISFREKEVLAGRIEAAARAEDLALADFVRKVFRYGFRQYETAGSLFAFRSKVEAAEEGKRLVELERAASKKHRDTSVGVKKKRKAS
jgi:hypothetical protein